MAMSIVLALHRFVHQQPYLLTNVLFVSVLLFLALYKANIAGVNQWLKPHLYPALRAQFA